MEVANLRHELQILRRFIKTDNIQDYQFFSDANTNTLQIQ